MKRAALLFIAVVFAVACGAWHAHASSNSPTPEASARVSRFPPIPSPTESRKMDEYGNIRWKDEKARLDYFIVELRNDPTALAYIFCYGGRRGREGEARRRCARAANYVVKKGGIAAARVVTVDGGFREDLTVELWKPAFGSTPPAAYPTVDPSEVIVIRDAPTRRRAGSRRAPRARAAVRRPA